MNKILNEEKIESESLGVFLNSPPVVSASKHHYAIDLDSTPLEFPELFELDLKVSEFISAYQIIATEGNINIAEAFNSTEVVEFDPYLVLNK